MRFSPLLLLPLLAPLACASPREAVVPIPRADALTRATHVLESFEYNVVEMDREAGLVRGLRTPEHLSRGTLPPGSPTAADDEVLWEVTVHVLPSGDGSLYRLESRTVTDLERFEQVDPRHLDRILAELAEWRR